MKGKIFMNKKTLGLLAGMIIASGLTVHASPLTDRLDEIQEQLDEQWHQQFMDSLDADERANDQWYQHRFDAENRALDAERRADEIKQKEDQILAEQQRLDRQLHESDEQ